MKSFVLLLLSTFVVLGAGKQGTIPTTRDFPTNIKWYGAKDVASFDSYSAITNAIGDAVTSTNRVVYIPSGRFYISKVISLTGITNLTIVGDGEFSVLTQPLASSLHSFFVVSGCSGVNFHNFQIDGRCSQTNSAVGILAIALDYSTNCVARGMYFNDLGQNSGTIGGSAMVIEGIEGFGGAHGNIVENCVFRDPGRTAKFGIRLYTDWELNLPTASITAHCSGNIVRNNKFIGYGWNQVEFAGPQTHDNIMENNKFEDHFGYTSADLDKGSYDNIVRGNTVVNLVPGYKSDGIATNNQAGFRDQGWPGSPYIRISHGNQFIDNTVTGIWQTNQNTIAGLIIDGAAGTVVNNLTVSGLYGDTNLDSWPAIVISHDNAFPPLEGPKISGGTWTNIADGLTIASVGSTGGVYNVTMKNVTMYPERSGYYTSSAWPVTNIVIAENHIYNHRLPGLLFRNEQKVVARNNWIESVYDNTGISFFSNATARVYGNTIKMPGPHSSGIVVFSNDQDTDDNYLFGCDIQAGANVRHQRFNNRADDTDFVEMIGNGDPPNTGKVGDRFRKTSFGASTYSAYRCIAQDGTGTNAVWAPAEFVVNTDGSFATPYGFRSESFINLALMSTNASYGIVSLTDNVIAVDCRTNEVPVTLPALFSGIKGRVYIIYDAYGSAATNNIVIYGSGTNLVNGQSSLTINRNYGGVMLTTDDNQWAAIAGFRTDPVAGGDIPNNADPYYDVMWDGDSFENSIWFKTSSTQEDAKMGARTPVSIRAGNGSSTFDRVLMGTGATDPLIGVSFVGQLVGKPVTFNIDGVNAPLAAYINYVQGASSTAQTVTNTPSILSAYQTDGAHTFFVGLSDTATVTFQDQSVLPGSALSLGAPTRTLAKHSVLELIWRAAQTNWVEVAFKGLDLWIGTNQILVATNGYSGTGSKILTDNGTYQTITNISATITNTGPTVNTAVGYAPYWDGDSWETSPWFRAGSADTYVSPNQVNPTFYIGTNVYSVTHGSSTTLVTANATEDAFTHYGRALNTVKTNQSTLDLTTVNAGVSSQIELNTTQADIQMYGIFSNRYGFFFYPTRTVADTNTMSPFFLNTFFTQTNTSVPFFALSNNGSPIFQVKTASGWTGAGTKALMDDGTFQTVTNSVGGGGSGTNATTLPVFGWIDFAADSGDYVLTDNYEDVVFGDTTAQTSILQPGTYIITATSQFNQYRQTGQLCYIELWNTETDSMIAGSERFAGPQIVPGSFYAEWSLVTQARVTITTAGRVKLKAKNGIAGDTNSLIRRGATSIKWEYDTSTINILDVTDALNVRSNINARLVVGTNGATFGGKTLATWPLKRYLYLYNPIQVDGAGCTNWNSNDMTNRPSFSGTAATNVNWALYKIMVPEDIDTTQDITMRVNVMNEVSDTAAKIFDFGMYSSGNGQQEYNGGIINWVGVTVPGTYGGTAFNLESISGVTLSGWKSSVQPGNNFVIKVQRRGSTDASTGRATIMSFSLGYTATGL